MKRRIPTAIALAMMAVGLLWIGQGLGYVRWPQSSFMIDQSRWVTRGMILAVAGLAIVMLANRGRR